MKAEVCFFYKFHNYRTISRPDFKFSLNFALFSFDFQRNKTQIALSNNYMG